MQADGGACLGASMVAADLRQAVALMARHKIGALPVMERGSLVGILSVTDLLKLLAELLGGTPG